MSGRETRVFGPVVSRRLGMSLGLDLVPMKTCTFNCVYCQLGRTASPTVTRASFCTPDEVVHDALSVLTTRTDIDYATLSGSGEPTLEIAVGEIIRRLKDACPTPVALITNGSLLDQDDVRADVLAADVILPSLDAGTEEIFRLVNRPHGSLTLERLLTGLEKLRHEYTGQIWLEVMLVKGFNDRNEQVRAIAALAKRVRPDRIQLNTVVRPPTEADSRALTLAEMEVAREFFGSETEIIADVSAVPGQGGETATHAQAVQRTCLDG